MDEDPWDDRTWSGSSRYFFSALEAQGALALAVSAEPPALLRRLYQLRGISLDRKRWRSRHHLDVRYYAQMTRAAKRRLAPVRPEDYDVLLQVGAWYDLTGFRGKPVVSYHDGTLAARLNNPYGELPVSRQHLRRALDYERALYGRIQLIFPMSEWLADSFIKDNGVSAAKVFPVGAGVNLPEVREVREKRYDEPRILFVGKDFARKGGRDLLEAFAAVRREIPTAELTVIGPEMPSAPPGVRALGPVSKSTPEGVRTLLDEYERATVFVLPSLYEPFGIVLAEAMAHRLPCVGTHTCAIPEIIADGSTGFVVPTRQPAALAERLVALLRDPSAAREFGNAGYARYQQRYTWQAVATSMLAVIRREL